MQTFVEIQYGGRTLRGMHHTPAAGREPCPVVLFLHGFTGNRIEGHRLFYLLSSALEQTGIASVRFDFLGSGESDGDYAEMTLPSLVQQATHVLRWAEKSLVPSQVFLVGFSLGGLVASLVTEQNSVVSKAVLVSPGRARRILERDKRLYQDTVGEVIDVSGNRVGKEYYESLEPFLNRPLQFHDHQRIRIIHGTRDVATPIEFGREYLHVPGGHKEFVEVEGADHGYSSLAWQALLKEHVLTFLGD